MAAAESLGMPTPLEVPEEMGERGSVSASEVMDETPVEQRENTHRTQWTAEEWQRWYDQRNAWHSWEPPTTTTPSGMAGSASQAAAQARSDPWMTNSDPWSSAPAGDKRDDDRSGGSDKISVPEFSGEDKDCLVTRGYLRKVNAWRRMTRLRPSKQALALYNALTGRAWRDAEELDLALLDKDDGVDVFIQWISEKYLDKEVVKVGKCMLDFFKTLKRGYNQEIRDFNQEYDRQASRLKEIGCNLPDICLAWLYVDKLRLENSAELNLLSSTGNKYDLSKLQEAATIQDRMNRRLWEREPRKMPQKEHRGAQHAHVAEALDEDVSADEHVSEPEDETFLEDDEEAQEAYVSYQNAKSKYKTIIKSRGTTVSNAQKDERIKQAKLRSYCSVCKRRGHWHRDPECPANQQKTTSATTTQVSHVCEIYFAGNSNPDELYAITDCACSRSLAGSSWIARLRENARAKGHHFLELQQDEKFKFGGDKLFHSTKAWCFWMSMYGHWALIKISEIETDVPLLLSRPVLAKLGMKFDLMAHTADFDAFGITGMKLNVTDSGLPSVPVADSHGLPPQWPKGINWVETEIYLPKLKAAYMVHPQPIHTGFKKLFFPKKLDAHIVAKLTEEFLSPEWFLTWWRDNEYLRDFWIEGECFLDRIHVTPRRDVFDPRTWNTQLGELKEQLLAELGVTRSSTCISCTSSGPAIEVTHNWHDEVAPKGSFLWIGRSRFQRSQVRVRDSALVNIDPVSHVGMEDAPCRAVGTSGGDASALCGVHDSPGAEVPLHRESRASRHARTGTHQDDSGTADAEMPRGEDRDSGAPKANTRPADALVALQPGDQRGDSSDLRPIQALHVQRGTEGVSRLGNSGMELGSVSEPRSGKTGPLGRPREEVPPSARTWIWSKLFSRPRDHGQDEATSCHATTKSSSPICEQEITGSCAQGEHLEAHEGKSGQRGSGGLHHGDIGGGAPDNIPGDRGSGGTSDASPRSEEGRGSSGSTRAKQRRFRESVKAAIAEKRERRANRRSGGSKDYEDVEIYESDGVFGMETDYKVGGVPSGYKNVERYGDSKDIKDAIHSDYEVGGDSHYVTEENAAPEGVFGKESSDMPKVKLLYGDDYESVRNLPKRRVRRTTRKKIKGWARKALCSLTALISVCLSPLEAMATHLVERSPDQVDLLELFAGKAHMTQVFAERGYNVLEPRDLRYGHDLSCPAEQEKVLDDILHYKPGLLWIALPCTKWSPWQRLNYHNRRQALRRERAIQRKLCRFALRCCELQWACGGECVFEHPLMSDMWDDDCFYIRSDPRMHWVPLDMCCFGLKAVSDGGPLKKPTALLCTNARFSELGRKCQGDHVHTPTAGQNTSPAGIYTYQFCNHVVNTYEKIKSQQFPAHCSHAYVGEEQDDDDMYSPGTPVDTPQGEIMEVSDEEMPPVIVPPDQGQPAPGEVLAPDATGISFPPHVGKTTAQALRRLHQNLGHPRAIDLARHLKLAGAKTEVVKAAHQLRCATCERHANPGTRRPAKVHVPLDFNHEVGVDTFVLYTPDKTKLNVMSILDVASGYHVVKLLTGRSSPDLGQAFIDGWISWAGVPHRVLVDQERGLMKDFTSMLEEKGVKVNYIAGQAHWKNGPVERQNHWFRVIWDKTIDHAAITDDDVEWTLAQVAHAKNTMRRKHGYSPSQWVFGSEPRIGKSIIDEDEQLNIHEQLVTPDDAKVRQDQIRQAAREAFTKSQADSALQRALLGRPRTSKDFSQGDWVYIYRKSKNAGGAARLRQGASEWIGPGTIVGVEGDSFWVSRGGRCLLCAREHLRHAESEELGMLFQAKNMKEDLMQLVNKLDADSEDESMFLEATDEIFQVPIYEAPMVPAKRARFKQDMPMVRHPGGEFEIPVRSAMVAELGEADKDFRMPKSFQKQLDKEVKWENIPEVEKPLYLAAEEKQWNEHLKYEAVKVLSVQESEKVRREVPSERILPCRFA